MAYEIKQINGGNKKGLLGMNAILFDFYNGVELEKEFIQKEHEEFNERIKDYNWFITMHAIRNKYNREKNIDDILSRVNYDTRESRL